MTPVSLRGILRLSLLLSVPLLVTAESTERILRLRADSWMPYNGEPSATLPGYAVEIARTIFEPRGIKVDYATMPWKDALAAATSGQIDGVIGANTKEAAQLRCPSEPVGEPSIALFVRKSNPWTMSGLPSLQNVRLGVIAGYSYWPMLDSYIARSSAPAVVTFDSATPLVDAIAKLDAGEIDVVVEAYPVWLWTLRESQRRQADYRTASVQPSEPIYIAFSPQNGAEYARIWDAGLRELRASGRLKPILAKYGLLDWR